MPKVEYYSNNSGGYDWLDYKQWRALLKAGWKLKDFDGPVTARQLKSARPKYAVKQFPSVSDAVLEFEELTGEDANAEGCNCCGPPHTFMVVNNA